MMKDNKELEYYLWNKAADKEERKCTRMWIRDGHSVDENDYGIEDMDFLTAIRSIETYRSYDSYTSSYYDPRTQEYIRSKEATRAEKRKMREHAKNGGRFIDNFSGNTPIDYLTYLRYEDDYLIAEFESEYGEYISMYGAEYLMNTKQADQFIMYIKQYRDTDNMEELRF